MSSVQHLREFIRERLTAAAQEIFTEVEKTIICYEEELDAQRRMMGIDWKPEIKLLRVGSELQRQSSDLQKPLIPTEEDMSVIPQVCPHKRRSSHDLEEAEPKQIKEEEVDSEQEKKEPDSSVLQHEQQPPEHLPTGQDQKDLCSSQEGEQLVQKQFVALTETSTLQEDDMNEEETRTEQLSLHVSPVVESKDQEGSSCSVSENQSDIDTKKGYFKCDKCLRWYRYQGNLKNHYRIHTGEKPFTCEKCGNSFINTYTLNLHIKQKHLAAT